MKYYYDLHIHSCLSPCGDNDMTPQNIVNMAALAGLQIIALTDHNSTRNCKAVSLAASEVGITLIPGMELCTSEEIHVVCLFPSVEDAAEFGAQLQLPPIKNKPQIFGQQLVMDEQDKVIDEETYLLINASGISIDQVLPLARCYHGTAFPAHIDRDSYSMPVALGDIPPLGFAVMEVSAKGNTKKLVEQYPNIQGKPLLLNSDAHYLHQIQDAGAWMDLSDSSPETVIAALDGKIEAAFGRSSE